MNRKIVFAAIGIASLLALTGRDAQAGQWFSGCGYCGGGYAYPAGQVYYAPPVVTYAPPTVTVVPHYIVQPNYVVRRTYIVRPTEYVAESPTCFFFCDNGYVVNQGQYNNARYPLSYGRRYYHPY